MGEYQMSNQGTIQWGPEIEAKFKNRLDNINVLSSDASQDFAKLELLAIDVDALLISDHHALKGYYNRIVIEIETMARILVKVVAIVADAYGLLSYASAVLKKSDVLYQQVHETYWRIKGLEKQIRDSKAGRSILKNALAVAIKDVKSMEGENTKPDISN